MKNVLELDSNALGIQREIPRTKLGPSVVHLHMPNCTTQAPVLSVPVGFPKNATLNLKDQPSTILLKSCSKVGFTPGSIATASFPHLR